MASSRSYYCPSCDWSGVPPVAHMGGHRRPCHLCGAALRRWRRPTQPTAPELPVTPHAPSEEWDTVRLVFPRHAALVAGDSFLCEQVEVAALVCRRVVAHRRPLGRMPASNVFAALSGLPSVELERHGFRRVARKKSNDQTRPTSFFAGPGYEVLTRCPVVAAVVAAAHVTRRPMRALTALSARLLAEGRAVLRRAEGA